MNNYFNAKNNPNIAQPVNPTPSVTPEGIPIFLRTQETGDKVYYVEDGIAYWVTDPQVLEALGGELCDIPTIPRDQFKVLKIGARITMDNVANYRGKPKEPELTKPEVKVYPEADSFKHENIAGLTSIIMPVYWVHYPSFHYTGTAIGSIREHTDKEKTPYEIILVINGDTGIKVDDLRLTYADKIIQNEENLGFSKAINQGIRASQGEYIAIVNNDVQVYEHWLEDMQACLKQLDLVMATPMYGKPFARALEAKALRNATLTKGDTDDVLKTTFSDFADFSCVLTTKELFDKVGLFNEEMFMYSSDLDLIRRIEKAGGKIASTKRVNTAHIIGATSSGINETPQIMEEDKKKLQDIWGY